MSRNESERFTFLRHCDFIVFIKYIDIPSKVQEFEIKLQISDSTKNWMKLIKLEIVVLIFAHVGCCIFLDIGQYEMARGKDTWISFFGYENMSIQQLYLTSLYYMIVSICTIGYGDIYPQSVNERLFLIVVALIATNMTAYTYSQISEIVKFEDSKKESFNKMMIGINYQMKVNGLCMNLQQRVRKFFEYKYQQNKQQLNISDQLINQLPKHLKEEVLLDLNKDIIYVHIFNDLSQSCQRQICLSMKQRQLIPDEIIVNQKELNECLFYLTHGNLEAICTVQKQNIFATYNNQYKLKKKDCFGYEGFILGEISPYSVKSIGSSIVSYIEKSTLIEILKQFPKDYEKFAFMKDKALFGLTVKSSLKFKCISCGQQDHYLLKCPYLTLSMKYKPCKLVNQRNPNFWRRQEKYHYNYCSLKSLQDIAMAVVINNDKTFMLEAVGIFKSQVIQEMSDDDYDKSTQNNQTSEFFFSNSNLKQKSNMNVSQQIEKYDSLNYCSEQLLQSPLTKKHKKKQTKAISYQEIQSPDVIKLDKVQQETNQNEQKFADSPFKNKIRELKSQESQISNISSVPQIKVHDQNKANKQNTVSFKSLKFLEESQQKDKRMIISSEHIAGNSLMNVNSQEANEIASRNELNQQDFQILQNQSQKTIIHHSKSMVIDQNDRGLLKQVFEKRQQRVKQMMKGLNKYISEKIQLQKFMQGQLDHFNNNIDNSTENLTEQNRNSIHSKYEQQKSQRGNFFNLITQLSKSLKNNVTKQNHYQSNLEVKVNEQDNNTDRLSSQFNNHQQNLESMKTSFLPQSNIKQHEVFETTEHQIRCERNLQDLDMLVVRKKFLLLQQQNIFHNFIEVPDNEIDIDISKDYFYYFHNHNLQIVLNCIRQRQESGQKQKKKEIKKKTSISKKRNNNSNKKGNNSNTNSPNKIRTNKQRVSLVI